MQKRISAADMTPVRVVIVTLDDHLAAAVERARAVLCAEWPGLSLDLHAAADWGSDPATLARCQRDIAAADIVIANMLFLDDQIQAILPALQKRQPHCDAMVCTMAAAEVVKLTRLGRLSMGAEPGGAMKFLKGLRGGGKKTGQPSAGADQMRALRRIPKILKFIPGTAQDLRAYFLTMQYWLAGSDANIINMVRFLVTRYADGPRRHLRGTAHVPAPIEYPDVGLYHPQLPDRIATEVNELPPPPALQNGTVGVLVLRSYVLAGNSGHYDGVIASLQARGLRVIPAFASGLDARPAIAQYFMKDGRATIDALVSLTGFSLVGGPAYNDQHASEETLAALDVPYVAAQPVEFQTLDTWEKSDQGLMPVEATIMVAIPELDGATGSMVYGGRVPSDATGESMTMGAHAERADMLARRVAHLVDLRRLSRADRKVAIVIFNFPPNAGNTGTAAYLSVFQSLHNTLTGLAAAGYQVEVPATPDALRERIVEGNAKRYGALANVHARISADDHVRRERYLAEIESQWGPAPGRQQSDGGSIHVLGERFGNVFVGIQPAFGYEGDPMRLLFEKGFAPTHAFSAFYRWIREDFGAHVALHFGTHGALEFMPGKQTGMSAACWPDRLIGDLPNLYLYAANNPSEGMLAKRRAAATLISYMTPPVAQAGLYRGLLDLKVSIEQWRQMSPADQARDINLASLIQAQAATLDLVKPEPVWAGAAASSIESLRAAVVEFENTLIPHGLHVVGEPSTSEERTDFLLAMAEASFELKLDRSVVAALVDGVPPAEVARMCQDVPADGLDDKIVELQRIDRLLSQDHELGAILHALDGGFTRPAPGGDVIRTPAVLPTGRNIHGFDPFRLPTAFAVADGARQAALLIERHMQDGNPFPESIALVLWGTDNLKSGGGPVAQALALLGTKPRFDSYGRLCGATLIPLAELGRPRCDVVMTLSGIFRDLLPLQIKLLAEAALLAASADEPLDKNFVRKHALAYLSAHGGDMETAALRVFGNADGAYGANVNNLVENGRWSDSDEMAETYTKRKGFAYGVGGRPMVQQKLLESVLQNVDLAYQNLESVELGVTTVDTYFDTLGGISSAVKRVKGKATPVYISDQTRGEGSIRTLDEQINLETRTRVLNPKWYEGMLKHGYEGVRQIETHVTNTVGWSATTGQVSPWVYQRISETFVLDDAMRERLATLNPTASAKLSSRLLEAHSRGFWQPSEEMLAALRDANDELEDRLEGVGRTEVAA
jgi:magnesium chelatase subunit H